MSIKSMVRRFDERRERKSVLGRGRSYIAPESPPPPCSDDEEEEYSEWSNLPPELLADVIRRLDASETPWPARRTVVKCASVCHSWRKVTKEIVRTPQECGLLTFPISLKQPGPRDHPIQCFISRDRGTSTYRLYLGLHPVAGSASKLLLAAKKTRKATETEFRISLASNDFRASETYVGKLRSNFFGTKFTVCDSQPAETYFIDSTKKVSQRSSPRNQNIASICYELNVLRTRGPRRMHCTMNTIQEEDTSEEQESFDTNKKPLILRNKTPRWHDQLQCWCLNFRGRVTVASVKNFQLVTAMEPLQAVPTEEQERVILQFGKIAKDSFTMDYRYPLSAFQAFAICLSSFDTKPACE